MSPEAEACTRTHLASSGLPLPCHPERAAEAAAPRDLEEAQAELAQPFPAQAEPALAGAGVRYLREACNLRAARPAFRRRAT